MGFYYQRVCFMVLGLLALLQRPTHSTLTINEIIYQEKSLNDAISGDKCISTVQGGAPCLIMTNGEVLDPSTAQICFTRTTDANEAKCIAIANTEKPYTGSGTNKISFYVPSLWDVRSGSRDINAWTYTYNIELQLESHASKIQCATSNACQIQFQMNYTPIMYQIFNGVGIYGQIPTYRVNLANARHLMKDGIPIRQITVGALLIEQMDGNQCDFTSDDLITDETDFNGEEEFHCKYQDYAVLTDGATHSSRFTAYAGHAMALYSAKTTLYDKKEFYTRILPSINSVNYHTGSPDGDHLLTITGRSWSLEKTEMSFTIDGPTSATNTPCAIQTIAKDDNDLYTATCKTAASAVTSGSFFPGGHGWQVEKYLGIDARSKAAGKTPDQKFLMFNAEMNYRDQKSEGQDFVANGKTLFKAPYTGEYYFWLLSDDKSELYVHATPNHIPPAAINFDTAQLTAVCSSAVTLNRPWYYRTAADDGFARRSAKVDLVKDSYYYMEFWHAEGNGIDFLQLGAEIKLTAQTDHPMRRPEVQRITVKANPNTDVYEITLDWPLAKHNDTYNFKLSFSKFEGDPDTGDWKIYQTGAIKYNATIAQFNTEFSAYLNKYFSNNKNLYFSERLIYKDAQMTQAAADDTEAIKVVYKVTTRYTVDNPRETAGKHPTISGNFAGTPNTIVFTEGEKGLAGTYKLKMQCPGTAVLAQSGLISPSAEDWEVRNQFWQTCKDYYYKVFVTRKDVFNTNAAQTFAGYSYTVSFDDYRVDIPVTQTALPLADSTATPPVVPLNYAETKQATLTVETLWDATQNHLFFNPAPYDWFYTPHTVPQVKVTRDGKLGACGVFTAGTECDYKREATTPKYTGTTSVADFTTATIAGTDLSITKDDYQTITFAGRDCTAAATLVSATEITCPVTNPIAGSHHAEMSLKATGKIGTTGTPAAIDIAPTITAVQPVTVTANGGQLITITGTRFPQAAVFASHTVAITIDGKACEDVTGNTITQMSCTTPATLVAKAAADVVVTIGGQAAPTPVQIAVTASTPQATLAPTSAAMNLKQDIVITLTGIGNDLSGDKTLFSAFLVGTKTYPMKVNTVTYNNPTHTITVRYPGADKGTYTVKLVHTQHGILTNDQTFQVGAKITNFNPKTGSKAGGTLITITGQNFSATPADVLVRFGSLPCDVVSVGVTQITCTSRPSPTTDAQGVPQAGQTDVAVIIKITEESICGINGGCNFDWTDATTPTITGSSWTGTQVTFTGTNLGNVVGDLTVKYKNLAQQVDTATGTGATATLTQIATKSEANTLSVHVAGKGFALIASGHTTKDMSGFASTYTAVAPATGSAAGQLITITGTNFAVDIAGTVKDTANVQICDSVTYVSITSVTCVTKAAAAVAHANTKLVIGSTAVNCATTCPYESTGALTPTATAVAQTDIQTYTVTGTNFPTGSTVQKATLGGVDSNNAVINSATQITLTFTNGIGYGNDLPLNALEFADGKRTTIDATAKVTVAFVGTLAQNTACSYAGGCLYDITANNVNKPAGALTATVCGLPCVYDQAESNDNSFKCRAPLLGTAYSAQTYTDLVPDQNWLVQNNTKNIEVQAFSNIANYGAEAFDQDVSNQSGIASGSCNIGLKIKSAAHKGTIVKVRYFLPRTTQAESYKGGKFQVSNDGTTYTDLFTIDSTPMEGWNGWDRVTSGTTANQYDTFSYIRYTPDPNANTLCDFMEIEVKGKIVLSETGTAKTCDAKVMRGTTLLATEANAVAYSNTLTPTITAIAPKYIDAAGNQQVTLTGTGFAGALVVKIDDLVCTNPAAANAGTTITCTTATRAALTTATLQVSVGTSGYAATNGLTFLYVSKWSGDNSWSGEFAPKDGDSLHIPKGQNLIFDIDTGPKLGAVLVEGSLILLPNANADHQRTFDAEYIFVRGGYMEVGTETAPYTSQLTITMHGNKFSEKLPIYGNKVIAVRDGILEMHGKERKPVWTDLWTTADVGATTMELNYDNTNNDFDWTADDMVVLAPTDFDFTESEKVKVLTVNTNANNRPVVTFTPALKFKHYAGVETFNDGTTTDTIEMRGEVGLLTRNIKFKGDETSANNKYGAHIMLHSPGDESLEGRFQYIELMHVGQAFNLGRYPLHFHMIGRVTKSYIKGCSIYHTFNRATTLHGVHYLTIENNVAFDAMGHTIFIEDAAETKNRIIKNLVISTKPSNSLLNTDQTPACFWITHPDNIFRDNHCAGSMRYGFWFDMQATATGPSFDPNICPTGERLGEFSGNVAHSVGRYGIRIFHEHTPRTKPCAGYKSSVDEAQYATSAEMENAAFASNPHIEAVYENYLGYKCGRSALITEITSHTTFRNFKVADCLQSGIEITRPGYGRQSEGKVENAVIVGMSANAGAANQYSGAKGIVTGQRDTFLFKNIRFHKFNQGANNNAAIGTTSHSAKSLEGEGFANTASLEGLTFTQVTNKIAWDAQLNILHDKDGSLTAAGAERWLTEWQPYFDITNICSKDEALDANTPTAVCSVPIRRLNFKNPQNFNELKGQTMKIALLKDVPVPPQGADDVTWTAELTAKYGHMGQNPKKPGQWDIPFPVGQTFNVHWQYGIDWTGVTLVRSRMFREADLGFVLRFNYTDRRDEFVVNTNRTITNATVLQTDLKTTSPASDGAAAHEFGLNKKNDTAQHLSVVVNGKIEDMGYTPLSTMTIEGIRCAGGSCTVKNMVAVETRERKWSVADDWKDANGNGVPPQAGQDVFIQPGWNMFYDIESADALEFGRIEVEGRLTFTSSADGSKHYELKAQQIIVFPGELLIGDQTTVYNDKATITLIGTPNQSGYAYNNGVMAGNKILFVANKLIVNAKDYLEGGPTHVKLLEKATKGSTTIKVQTGLKWKANDEIAIAATSYDYLQTEFKKISAYDTDTGVATLTTALEHEHYGAAAAETHTEGGNTYNYDMRGEVGHLTRNVVIQGNEGERWGGQIVVADFLQTVNETQFQGYAQLKNVEIKRMSQYDTSRAAIRFEKAGSSTDAKGSIVERCSIAHSSAWALAVNRAKNLQFKDNVIYETHRNAIKVEGVTDFVMSGNLIMKNSPREWDSSIKLKDHQFAVDICSGEVNTSCVNAKVQNNILAGGKGGGWLIPAGDCTTESVSEEYFKNNVVHSLEVGLILHIDQAKGAGMCGLLKNNLIHHNWEIGLFSTFAFSKLVLKNNVLVENGATFHLQLQSGAQTNGEIIVQDSLVFGEHENTRNCEDKYEKSLTAKRAIYSCMAMEASNTDPFAYPTMGWFKVMGNAMRGNTCKFSNVVFKDFPGTGTRCSATRPVRVFQTHPQGSDLIMQQIFSNIILNNIDTAHFMFLMDPPPGWINLTDCVDFDCTGPENMMLSFRDGLTQSGTTSISELPSLPFDIISDNPGYNTAMTTCTRQLTWNANVCTGDDKVMLVFESLDADKMDRSVQPVYLTQPDTPNNNDLKVKLNSFMDHVWDGFYTGQKRLLRFPVILQANTGNFHVIEYTGTPPLSQLFELYYTQAVTDALKLRLLYTNPDVVQVTVGGNAKDRKPLSNGVPQQLTGTECGENRWIHGVNQLEFTILPQASCAITLVTKQSIALSFRVQMTVNEFYANNGEQNFLDQMVAALGISQSRIRIVGVYEGSVVIESQITEDTTSNASSEQNASAIESLSATIQTKANEGSLLTNWNVLDMSMTVNTYPGGVATVTIPTIQPNQSMNVVGLVMLVVLGLVVVSALALLVMYFLNRKKLKAGGLHALVFNKNSSKVLNDAEDGKNSGVYEPEAKNTPQSEDSMRIEDVSAPRVVPV